jgi:hypothetical protein
VYLQEQHFDASLDLLKRAEMLAMNNKEAKAITYNNYAVYFKNVGKIRTAL